MIDAPALGARVVRVATGTPAALNQEQLVVPVLVKAVFAETPTLFDIATTVTRIYSTATADCLARLARRFWYRLPAFMALANRQPLAGPVIFPIGPARLTPAGFGPRSGGWDLRSAGLANAVRTRLSRLVVPTSPLTGEVAPPLDLALQLAGLVDTTTRGKCFPANHALSVRHEPKSTELLFGNRVRYPVHSR